MNIKRWCACITITLHSREPICQARPQKKYNILQQQNRDNYSYVSPPRNQKSARTKLAQIRKEAIVLYTIVGGPVVVGGASEGGVGRGWEVTGLASSPSVCATPSELSSTPSSAPLGWLNCFHFSCTVCVICTNKGTGMKGENQSRDNGNI